MTDIVERLRDLAHACRLEWLPSEVEDVNSAADEIERLRAERDQALALQQQLGEELFAFQERFKIGSAINEETCKRWDALRADAGRYRWLREWMVKRGLLHALSCQPERGVAVGYYWILRNPAVLDGNSCEGYGKTEEAAIDAAMRATAKIPPANLD